jgi:DNA-binding PucR family transcriptional regulator
MSASLVPPPELVTTADARVPEPAPAPDHDTLPALFEIVHRLQADEFHVDRLLEFIVQQAAALLRTDLAWVTLIASDSTYVAATFGAHTPEFRAARLARAEGLGGTALRLRRTLIVPDYRAVATQTPSPARGAVMGEGVESLMCAPMVLDGVDVGVVYVGNRAPTGFTEAHASLLSTLAAQACVALRNGALHAELQHSSDVIQQSFAIHRRLTDASLREGGIEDVARALAGLIGAPIAIEQALVAPSHSWVLPDGTVQDRPHAAQPSARVEIGTGDERLGMIYAYGLGALTELDNHALEHGATVVAAELLRRRAAMEAEWRVQGELLESLVESGANVSDAVLQRASQLGFDPSVARRLVAIAGDAGAVEPDRLLGFARSQAALALMGHGVGAALAFQRGEDVIVAVPAEPERATSDLIGSLRSRSSRIGSAARIGVSRPRTDLDVAYREATACLRLARGSADRAAVVTAEGVGPAGLLLPATSLEQASAMVVERLGALRDEDRTSRIPLLETLRAYVEAGGHHITSAARCFVHPSTLKYRMAHIETLFDAPLGDFDVQLELGLAFKVLDVLEALGEDPLQRQAPG